MKHRPTPAAIRAYVQAFARLHSASPRCAACKTHCPATELLSDLCPACRASLDEAERHAEHRAVLERDA